MVTILVLLVLVASAMGVYTNAAGPGSFAAGYSNNANGQNSVAIGSENTSHVADTITMGQRIMLKQWAVSPLVRTI